MQLVFTKGSGKHDRLDVIRNGEPAETIECPKQDIIPHDMVHYAVESTLHKRGFLSHVLGGEQASFQMADEAESDGVERLVEVLQTDGWSGWSSILVDMMDLYAVTCSARQCAPLAIQVEDIEAVRNRILVLTEQWQSVQAGKSLVLRFEHEQHAPR